MKGDEVIARGDIVITDNRITAIGPSGKVQIPAGAVVRNLSGKTIMPGLVDIHAHTWVAWGVHRSQVSQFLAQLAFGVTTQRDPQTSSEDALTYQDLMDTGQLIGPRLYSTGPGIFAADNIRSLDDARDVLRRYSDHYNTKTIKQYMVGDRKVRQWVIMAAKELGLTPTTEGGSNFTMNLTLMQDGYAGLEHTLPISPFFNDVVKLGAASGITYTPTLIVSYGGPIGPAVLPDARRTWTRSSGCAASRRTTSWTSGRTPTGTAPTSTCSRCTRSSSPSGSNGGGKLGLGSHGEVQGIGAHWELWMMASGGMKPHAALQAATIDGADAIGFAKDLGSLEAGKLADLIVLDANPLDDIKNTAKIARGDEERPALRRGDAERDVSAPEGAGPAVVVEAGAAGAAGRKRAAGRSARGPRLAARGSGFGVRDLIDRFECAVYLLRFPRPGWISRLRSQVPQETSKPIFRFPPSTLSWVVRPSSFKTLPNGLLFRSREIRSLILSAGTRMRCL